MAKFKVSSNRGDVYGLPQSKKCTHCGKTFYPAINHIYKLRDSKWQCSYTCYRAEGGDHGKFSKSPLYN